MWESHLSTPPRLFKDAKRELVGAVRAVLAKSREIAVILVNIVILFVLVLGCFVIVGFLQSVELAICV